MNYHQFNASRARVPELSPHTRRDLDLRWEAAAAVVERTIDEYTAAELAEHIESDCRGYPRGFIDCTKMTATHPGRMSDAEREHKRAILARARRYRFADAERAMTRELAR